MRFISTELRDVIIIEPSVHKDDRGYFSESFRQNLFEENIRKVHFVQENESFSKYGTLRGLHYQTPPHCQSKLVRVTQGSVIDFIVDMRKDSPTFGRGIQVELSDENKRQLWVPRGFAHGFLVTSEYALFQYKVDNYYSKANEQSVNFFDPAFQFLIPVPEDQLILSAKDREAPCFNEAWVFLESESLYER